jgi:hypothetical protein
LIALVGSERIGALLRKEKDGISPPKLFFGGFVEFTSIPRLRSLEVFYFQNLPASRWSLNRKNRSREKLFSANKIERSANEKIVHHAGNCQPVRPVRRPRRNHRRKFH